MSDAGVIPQVPMNWISLMTSGRSHVVEMELLHHDILRELGEVGLLAGLTFIGGTRLRACYGSARLSEDQDFTGGNDFKRSDLAELGSALSTRLQTRYGLPVGVSEPETRDDFVKEIRRFLPAAMVRDTVEKETYWAYLLQIIDVQATRSIKVFR